MKLTSLIPLIGILVAGGPAFAQADATQKVLASQLFDDAQSLFSLGHVSEACSKYSESQRLDPQLGTLLYLGDCYDKLGKTASAWVSFKDAVEIAHQRRDEREALANERLDELQAKLSKLTIELGVNQPPALLVLQDGEPLGRAVLGSALPIDPGHHEIRARAEGYKDWSIAVEVPAAASELRVTIQSLEPLPPQLPRLAPQASSPESRSIPLIPKELPIRDTGNSRRTLGYIIGGVGLVGLGVGTAFALAMNSKLSDRKNANACSSADGCTLEEKARIDQLTSDAHTDATVANVAFIAGSAAVIGGLVIVVAGLDSDPKMKSGIDVKPWFGRSTSGLNLETHW